MTLATDPVLADTAGLLRCTGCGGRRWFITPVAVTCEGCGRRHAVHDGVLHIDNGDEDPAIQRERDAMLAVEAASAASPVRGPADFTVGELLASTGALRDALLALPYGADLPAFQVPGYFANVRRFAESFDWVARRVPRPSGGRLLDVGADLTWSSARLAAHGWRVTAIDISHHLPASRVFRAAGPAYGVVNVDMHASVFADEAFQAVTAFNALHHTHRLPALVERLARALAPGGHLGMVEPYWFFEQNRERFGRDEIDAGINENIYRLEEWHQVLAGAGFELTECLVSHAFHAVYVKGPSASRRVLTGAEAQDELFAAHYLARVSAPPEIPGVVPPGATVALPVRVENRARAAWSSDGQLPALLSYHVHVANAGVAGRSVAEGGRTPLRGFLSPGEHQDHLVPVALPREPGDYVVRVDLLHELRCWFADHGGVPSETIVHVGTAG